MHFEVGDFFNGPQFFGELEKYRVSVEVWSKVVCSKKANQPPTRRLALALTITSRLLHIWYFSLPIGEKVQGMKEI